MALPEVAKSNTRKEKQMKRLIFGVAALPLLTGLALAGQPVQLTDNQMDKVTAGVVFSEVDISDLSVSSIAINEPQIPCSGCYLNIVSPFFNLEAAMIHVSPGG
jgi:hypothetical protein